MTSTGRRNASARAMRITNRSARTRTSNSVTSTGRRTISVNKQHEKSVFYASPTHLGLSNAFVTLQYAGHVRMRD